VLKLLQKPYLGRVKMSYLDPPYNTGKEIIYPENFRDGLEDYLPLKMQRSYFPFQSSSYSG
jgi:adenine-specific DNA-methyltransferase